MCLHLYYTMLSQKTDYA